MNPLPLKGVDAAFSANPGDLHQNGFVRTDTPKPCPGANEGLHIGACHEFPSQRIIIPQAIRHAFRIVEGPSLGHGALAHILNISLIIQGEP
ncbi:hypothetical protein HORIV_28550 [Vreelandella olivaria]|uniref:Uncharacterized protein n=1 Tax=Vreelandella olivaria TaxID=390919 RepID=A0ABM7GIH3_9GAMM|nr:hypothetical protein HORIV_28550 [Halomonas olivaria]